MIDLLRKSTVEPQKIKNKEELPRITAEQKMKLSEILTKDPT